ncbi:MAG: glycosyltransferase [Candidatus Omnitrophica bacterium]|nr:glycosyltransferase [Candidatus Omnitrophota bacterium]
MNILMMTNTYIPIVGGIERSIECFSREYRSLGHEALIVAPVFKNMPDKEEDVFRIPAIQNFNGTDFSVELPVPGILKGALDGFGPEIVHSHHPFLVGDTALRVSARREIPIVFTYHTMYELNTHYVPGDSEALKKFVVQLAAGYCDLCDKVIAPSRSIKELLESRGVRTEIVTIPTGIDASEFEKGSGASIRRTLDIPEEAFVAGYLGRIAEEKNMDFLFEAVMSFLREEKDAHFLVVGDGGMKKELEKKASSSSLGQKIHFTGVLKGEDKVNAYHAMDAFVFASKSETQGLVLAEAMASGVPVIGLDAPGAREVVRDGKNGFLADKEDVSFYAGLMQRIAKAEKPRRAEMSDEAVKTARSFDYRKSAERTLELYRDTMSRKRERKERDKSIWSYAKRSINKEMEIISNMMRSAGAALNRNGDEHDGRKKQTENT